MRVPQFDATRANSAIEAELVEAFTRVLRSGKFILEVEVERFETLLSEKLGVPHAIGVSSGTDALLGTLMALGVGRGDEVICPAFGFVATPEAVWRVGATPVFADVEPTALLLDPNEVARRITTRTRAVIPVHLFGRCADMRAIMETVQGRTIAVIEDAAQALGSTRGGIRAGSMGDAGCFSFFPTKNLGGFGDGGLVATQDGALAETVRAIRNHGATRKGDHDLVGGNFRLDAVHAALLAAKLPSLDLSIARRRTIAARYRKGLATSSRERVTPLGDSSIDEDGSTHNQFVVRIHGPDGSRDAMRAHLSERGIGSAVYYPRPLPRQKCFAALPSANDSFPVSERAAAEVLALPMFPELADGEVDEVLEAIASA